jgi:hypothetical protein
MGDMTDFDWEYPGADDRGGSEEDGVNYTALLRELQEAISASGREYIVTFTAPTSYWYLRHFDLKNMEQYVSWINLMSYDLHGVWDSSNPIGNIVLSHTNLTEIDLALDLVRFHLPLLILIESPPQKLTRVVCRLSSGASTSSHHRLSSASASMAAPSSWNQLHVGNLAVLLMGRGQKADAHGQQASCHTAVRSHLLSYISFYALL